MARTVHHVSFLVILETLCSKGHSLVEGYVVANDGCLANNSYFLEIGGTKIVFIFEKNIIFAVKMY